MKRLFSTFSTLLLFVAVNATNGQDYGSVLVQSLSYIASWEQYTTRADAEASTSSIGSGSISTRDLELGFTHDNPFRADPSLFIFKTGHNLTAGDGTPNPANTNEGFIQIFDLDGSTLTNVNYGFSGVNNSIFNLSVTGENALRGSSGEFARAGVGPNAANSTGGDWLYYEFDFTFFGLTTVSTGGGNKADSGAPNVIGSGFILFENTQTELVPNSSLGFYRIDLTIGNDSWAVENGGTVTTELEVAPIPELSHFSSAVGLFTLLLLISRRGSARQPSPLP